MVRLVVSGTLVLALSLFPACSDGGDGGRAGAGGAAGTGGAPDAGADATGGADAGPDAADASLKGTPGISCGSATCDTATEVCCKASTTSLGCAPKGSTDPCVSSDAGSAKAQYCDDSFDCAAGEICCDDLESGWKTVCAAAGTCAGRELCQKGSDCATAGTVCTTNEFGFSECGNSSPSVPCAGATCTSQQLCCLVGQTASCMGDKACQGANGERYLCASPADCTGGMRCCAMQTGFSRCAFECGSDFPDTLCTDAADCPQTAPTCAATSDYVPGMKHCVP